MQPSTGISLYERIIPEQEVKQQTRKQLHLFHSNDVLGYDCQLTESIIPQMVTIVEESRVKMAGNVWICTEDGLVSVHTGSNQRTAHTVSKNHRDTCIEIENLCQTQSLTCANESPKWVFFQRLHVLTFLVRTTARVWIRELCMLAHALQVWFMGH